MKGWRLTEYVLSLLTDEVLNGSEESEKKPTFCRLRHPKSGTKLGTLELCHEKICLKIFVIVILKEGLAGWGPAILLGMTPTIKLYSLAFTDCILQLVSYQKKDWLAGSFGIFS